MPVAGRPGEPGLHIYPAAAWPFVIQKFKELMPGRMIPIKDGYDNCQKEANILVAQEQNNSHLKHCSRSTNMPLAGTNFDLSVLSLY